jgi:hypothetical protein
MISAAFLALLRSMRSMRSLRRFSLSVRPLGAPVGSAACLLSPAGPLRRAFLPPSALPSRSSEGLSSFAPASPEAADVSSPALSPAARGLSGAGAGAAPARAGGAGAAGARDREEAKGAESGRSRYSVIYDT